MSLIRYEPDHKGTGQLLVSQDMRRVMRIAGEAGQTYAESISPDQEPFSAGYIASFEVDIEVQTMARSPRVTAILRNTADYAAAVEWRWDHHVLGRTVDYLENAWVPRG